MEVYSAAAKDTIKYVTKGTLLFNYALLKTFD